MGVDNVPPTIHIPLTPGVIAGSWLKTCFVKLYAVHKNKTEIGSPKLLLNLFITFKTLNQRVFSLHRMKVLLYAAVSL